MYVCIILARASFGAFQWLEALSVSHFPRLPSLFSLLCSISPSRFNDFGNIMFGASLYKILRLLFIVVLCVHMYACAFWKVPGSPEYSLFTTLMVFLGKPKIAASIPAVLFFKSLRGRFRHQGSLFCRCCPATGRKIRSRVSWRGGTFRQKMCALRLRCPFLFSPSHCGLLRCLRHN